MRRRKKKIYDFTYGSGHLLSAYQQAQHKIGEADHFTTFTLIVIEKQNNKTLQSLAKQQSNMLKN